MTPTRPPPAPPDHLDLAQHPQVLRWAWSALGLTVGRRAARPARAGTAVPAPPRRGVPPLMLAFAQTCAATVLLALTLPVAGRQVPQLTATVLIAITVLGVLGTGIAYVIHYALITTEDPTAAGVVTYLVPAVSVALDATFLSEPTGPNLLGGAALILLGVAWSSAAARPGPRTRRLRRDRCDSSSARLKPSADTARPAVPETRQEAANLTTYIARLPVSGSTGSSRHPPSTGAALPTSKIIIASRRAP